MTTEQREAIDRLKNLLAKGKYGIAGKMLLYDDYYMLKNVLEVVVNQERKIIKQQEKIEKRDKIIDEQLKENVKLQTELNTENNRCMILANNNKFKEQMIDLMAEWISERCFYKDDYSNSCEIIQDSCNKEDDCKDCIKQYFERKAENEK